jgi:hypothetical protein
VATEHTRIAASTQGARVIGVDIAAEMISVTAPTGEGRQRAYRVEDLDELQGFALQTFLGKCREISRTEISTYMSCVTLPGML